MRLAGYHALNSLRMEKAYRHWATTSATRTRRLRLACSLPSPEQARRVRRTRAGSASCARPASGPTRGDPSSGADRVLYHNEPIAER